LVSRTRRINLPTPPFGALPGEIVHICFVEIVMIANFVLFINAALLLMDIPDSYKLIDFETYCSVIIEIDRINWQALRKGSDTQILAILSRIMERVEKVIAIRSDGRIKDKKRAILNRLLSEYEVYLRSK